MDLIDILGLVLVLIRVIIIVPVMLYGLVLFRKFRKHELIKYRNPTLINIMVALSIITILCEGTFRTAVCVWNIINVHIWVVYFVFSIFWWALFGLFAIKVYNLYYKQKYNISITDYVWKKDINPESMDWYIKNQHKWGSTLWLVKFCLAPYIVSCVTDAVFPIFFGEGIIFDFFHSGVICIPVCVSFVVLYQSRTLNDIYRIKNEVFYQFILTFFALFTYIVIFCVVYFHLRPKYTADLVRIEFAIYTFLCDLAAIAFAVIPTFYPIYLIHKDILGTVPRALTLSDEDIHVGLASMSVVFAKYETFRLFVDYLVSEFDAENALFLVELVQIKHNYQKRNNFRVTVPKLRNGECEDVLIDFKVNPFDGASYASKQDLYFTYLFHDSGSIRNKISIPLQIPESHILTQHENNLCQQMLCLYRKYIDKLNISYGVHQDLDAIFGSEQTLSSEAVLFNSMDECAAEILSLLENSYARFTSTDSFASILNIIKRESENNKLLSNLEINQMLNSDSVSIVTKVYNIDTVSGLNNYNTMTEIHISQ